MRSWEGKIFSMNRAILFSRETNDAFTGFLSHELAWDEARTGWNCLKNFQEYFSIPPLCFCFSKHSLKLNLLRILHFTFKFYLPHPHHYVAPHLLWERISPQFLGEERGETAKYFSVFFFSTQSKREKNIIFPPQWISPDIDMTGPGNVVCIQYLNIRQTKNFKIQTSDWRQTVGRPWTWLLSH